jgi:hypothetical protein
LLALTEVVQADPGDACTTSCQRFETPYQGFDRQDRFIRLSDILPLVHFLERAPYVREEAGTHRYNVGTLWKENYRRRKLYRYQMDHPIDAVAAEYDRQYMERQAAEGAEFNRKQQERFER